MKKLLSYALITLALVACGDNKTEKAATDTAEKATEAATAVKEKATEATKEAEKTVEAAVTAKVPANCQEYITAVEKLVAKAPDAAKQFKDALEQTKAQWENLTDEQMTAANDSCKQMIEQIKPMLGQ